MFLVAPLALAAAPSLISGIASFFGQSSANKANRQEAERNRQFQERMRNTEWQAAVADMQAAGINPAVAYSHGGASSPSGSMAASQESAVGAGVGSAMQSLRLSQEMKLMKSQITKTSAEAEAAAALAAREKARNIGYGIKERSDGSIEIDYSMPGLVQETQASVAERIAAAARAKAMADITGIGGQVATGFQEVMPAFQSLMGVAGRGAGALAGVADMAERVARMRDDTVRTLFGASKAAVLRMLKGFRD